MIPFLNWFRPSSSPRRASRRPARKPTRPSLETLEDRVTPSVTFQLDYTYDTAGFFNAPGRRAVLQAAADALGSQLNDTLTEIPAASLGNSWSAQFPDPQTGQRTAKGNLRVPANTLIVYVGARPLINELGEAQSGFSWGGSVAWGNTVQGRGQPGALGAEPAQTDVAPWGGSIAFEADPARPGRGSGRFSGSWYFGLAPSVPAGQADFFSVAQHELGHLLGFGAASWKNLIRDNLFRGQAAQQAFGGPVPTDGGPHWKAGTKYLGRPVTMDGQFNAAGRVAFTELDFAALRDIGWQVSSPAPRPQLSSGSAVTATSHQTVRGLQQDLFAVGTDGRIWTTFGLDGVGWSRWFTIGGPQDTVPVGSVVTATVHQTARGLQQDLFVVGTDGRIRTTFGLDGVGWSPWFTIGRPQDTVPVRSVVTATVHQTARGLQQDLFVVGTNGGVYTTFGLDGVGWAPWFRISASSGTVPVGSVVTATMHQTARGLQQDLFAVGTDGGVYTAFGLDGIGWSPWFRISASSGTVPVRSVVTATVHNTTRGLQQDLFAVGTDGGVYTAFGLDGVGWSRWFRIGRPQDIVPVGSVITATVHQTVRGQQQDLFVVGTDGRIRTTFGLDGVGWSPWFTIGGPQDTVPARSVITATVHNTARGLQQDLFVVGPDGRIRTTFGLDGVGWVPWFSIDTIQARR